MIGAILEKESPDKGDTINLGDEVTNVLTSLRQQLDECQGRCNANDAKKHAK